MVRSSILAVCILSALVSRPSIAQSRLAYDLLPDTTQAVVWIPNGDRLLEQWRETQLSKLLADESVAPFFDDQRQEIQQRFMDAGWRLNVKPEDVSEYANGQLAFAWTTKEGAPLKPFALVLIADVENDPDVNAAMMATIEKQLDPKQTKKQSLKHNGISVTKYSLPPRRRADCPGQLLRDCRRIAAGF